MKKILLTIFILITLYSCTTKKSIDHHGVHLLKKKSNSLIISESNKNDIIKLLGPPSVTSSFDNDLYFYIERKTTTDAIYKLGKKKFIENNVLILEIDDRGLLYKMDFYDLNKMRDIKIVSSQTEVDYRKNNFIYDFLSSMRQKINDPLGKRKRD
tara:strand:+ start:235 stop:699 length:465 start_codon:yes stop_codon:yes gene_type:complete